MTIELVHITKEQEIHTKAGVENKEFAATVTNGKTFYVSDLGKDPLVCEIQNYIIFLGEVLQAITNTEITKEED